MKFFQRQKLSHIYTQRQRGRDRDLVARVDINGSYPELQGALPRSDMVGELFLNIVEIERRQHSAVAFAAVHLCAI
jgi:hypothetical protein